MSSQIPTRDAALALLKKYNTSQSLIKHAFAVKERYGHESQIGQEKVERQKFCGGR
ncbi:MAG: hypothetical protein PHG14_10370 [Desulfobacter postgatei]|uniref:hypothetical protein n=1 Tax=Desulfobacter postgatei TaxID=2293 RepID=UPI000232AC67|nr:hypothetical protein [Desulfobacter postgatei]MDD4274117.1 hypothetical protein [Desulfobacter postgatei]